MVTELSPDQKGLASLTLGDVIQQTRENFPDPRFRPQVYLDAPPYHLYGINPSPFSIWVTADGIGTKPELAERLATEYNDPSYFESLAFDTFAMIESDEARWGRINLGIVHIIDTNTATPEVMAALARGTKRACDEGHFALLNGETAELGYRTAGYGRTRINWNAIGLSLVVPEKLILGQDLKPGQPIVGLREFSIRSNGLTRARTILEKAYLRQVGYVSKRHYFTKQFGDYLKDRARPPSFTEITRYQDNLGNFMDEFGGENFWEQILLPWHQLQPEVTKELLRPSMLYGKLMYEAQGGVDGEKAVNITAAAHISGGGVPEKAKRMVAPKGLGADIRAVFPDPLGVRYLFELAEDLTDKNGESLLDDRGVCEQWNRGIGFLMVTQGVDDAKRLIELASNMGYEAAEVGKIIEEPVIKFRGHTWNY